MGAAPAVAAHHPIVAARLPTAASFGTELGELVQDPTAVAARLRSDLAALADPECLGHQRLVAPGIGLTHGVRSALLRATVRTFAIATRHDSPSALLSVADRLLREPELEARWFAIRILDRTVRTDPERSWQLIRRAGREAADWITVDTLAHPAARGIAAEPYRWAELEQLVYAPSRWERRLVGSTIATLPFADRTVGRAPTVAGRALPILGMLIGDAEPDVQKALAWAYRSLTIVDRDATTAALEREAETARRAGDGHRAWVVRDALPKIQPRDAARLRASLAGIRRRAGDPSTATAAATAARFSDLGLGHPMPEPPLT